MIYCKSCTGKVHTNLLMPRLLLLLLLCQMFSVERCDAEIYLLNKFANKS